MQFTELSGLSDEAVVSSLKDLVADGNRILAKVIAYLVEIERRRIHLDLACSSMFDFCTRKLGFSEGEAFRRITAARLVRRFPTLLDALDAGRIHLSNMVLLRDHFTESNLEGLLETAARKSKREVLELIARLSPRPDVASSIRKLPEREGPKATSPSGTVTCPPSYERETPKPRLEPLSASRYKLQLTATQALRDKLERARDLMRHRHPDGDLAIVVERAMDLLLDKLEKERKASRPREGQASKASKNPGHITSATGPEVVEREGQASKASKNPGHITRATRREVVERDGAQCSFIAKDGARCPSHAFLEFDHRHPRALGGTGEAPNVRLLCRAHNVRAAEAIFGREYVAERIDFFQRKSKGRANTSEAHRRAAASCGHGATTPAPRPPLSESSPSLSSDDDGRKGQVRSALRNLGFRGAETDRALAMLEHRGGFEQPVELLLRDALAILT